MIRVLTQSLKIVSIFVVAVVLIGGSIGFFNYWVDRERDASIGRPVTIQISEDDSVESVAETLQEQDLIRYNLYFETRMRFDDGELLPGTYTLDRGLSTAEIIDEITVPVVGVAEDDDEAETGVEAPTSIEVTFIEGQRLEEFAAQLDEAGYPAGGEAFLEAANDTGLRDRWDILDDLPDGQSVEGYLFPDTYVFGSNASPTQVVDLMISRFDEQFSAEMRQEAQAAGLTIHEVVTLASIVEREAAVNEERTEIAAVYLNRVDEGMLLGADPTIQYIVGTSDDWWPSLNTALLEEAEEADSPYNTYFTRGIPPGPIASPGAQAMQAVIRPADVGYLYFVARNDGSGTHEFANTLEEHEENICTFIPEAEGC